MQIAVNNTGEKVMTEFDPDSAETGARILLQDTGSLIFLT